MNEITSRFSAAAKARAAALSPERRTEIARRGAQVRWSKPRPAKAILVTPSDNCKALLLQQLDQLYSDTLTSSKSAYTNTPPPTWKDHHLKLQRIIESLP